MTALGDALRPPRPHAPPGRVHRGRRPARDDEPGRRLPARRSTGGACCSTRAASGSRGTASRPRRLDAAGHGRRHARPGGRTSFDIEAVQARDGPGRAAGTPGRAAGVRPVTALIGGRRPITGRKPGDKRIRVERPHTAYFRYTGPGQLTAKAAASAPTTGLGGRRPAQGVLLGRPLANEEEIGERLSKKKALAIFSSDAISSSAYATEEIILAFILAGFARRGVRLLDPGRHRDRRPARIVAFSYRQVCIAYPTGGGSYSVSKANLGPARVARRRLGAAHRLHADRRRVHVVRRGADRVGRAVARPVARGDRRSSRSSLITLGNLRGLREAGNIFAIPTYLFLGCAFLMIAMGIYRILFQGDTGPAPTPAVVEAMPRHRRDVGILILLRAFASGAVALTGTEAIATGVPAFKPPEARNAAATLMAMAVILGDPVHRDHVPRQQLPHPADRGARSRPSSPRSRATSTATRSVLPVPGVHGPAPVPRREHLVRRVPAPGRRARRGRLHPPPVRVPRRPPRLLDRDHHPGHRRRAWS